MKIIKVTAALLFFASTVAATAQTATAQTATVTFTPKKGELYKNIT